MRKWVFTLGLVLSLNANADSCPDGVVRCGTTDDGFTWTISNIKDENNNDVILPSGEIAQELSIQGTGDMKDYASSAALNNCPPWKEALADGSKNAAPTITSIVIGDGITSIGKSAFEYMRSVKNVVLPEGLKIVKAQAFNSCPITELHLPDSLEELGSFAFSSTVASEIILPEGLKKIGEQAFYNTINLSDIVIPEGTNVSVGAFAILDGQHNRNIFIQNIYCAGTNTSCQALKNNSYMKDKVQFYESDGNGYFSGNKWYANLHDIGTPNYIKKRIYTIDEAQKVTGDKNRVSIKYR